MKKHLLLVGACVWMMLSAHAQNLKLWYQQPAKTWVEALPVGNSSMGAMVYGGTSREELQLNEETLWGGGPYRNDNPKALESLAEVRNLIFSGKTMDAQNLIDQTFYTGRNGMPYQTIGSLIIEAPGHEKAKNYYRDLNLERAVATTRYQVDGVNFQREVFASFPDRVIIVRFTTDKPGELNFKVSYDSPLQSTVRKQGKKLVLRGKGGDHEGVKGVIEVETQSQVIAEGGKVSLTDKYISVEHATAATLYIAAATNFVNYHNVKGNESKKASALLAGAMKKEYSEALKAHTDYYQSQFNRVSLSLGGENTKTARQETVKRIAGFSQGNDPALAALMFQYGRYLLISSSQPGGQPANLQGIWNHQLNAPWDGKYTININTEMNYWHVENCNLSECHIPLFELLKKVQKNGSVPGILKAAEEKGFAALSAELAVGEPTLRDIAAELERPGRDLRDDLPQPVLRRDVLSMADLQEGMELTGTVRNVVDFGAFVDIGVHEDGLVHVSQFPTRVSHPSQAVRVGDVVKVRVLSVDQQKKRIALTMRPKDAL